MQLDSDGNNTYLTMINTKYFFFTVITTNYDVSFDLLPGRHVFFNEFLVEYFIHKNYLPGFLETYTIVQLNSVSHNKSSFPNLI